MHVFFPNERTEAVPVHWYNMPIFKRLTNCKMLALRSDSFCQTNHDVYSIRCNIWSNFDLFLTFK